MLNREFLTLLKIGAKPVLYVLGVIVAIASVSAFLQKLLGIQLAEYPETVLGYYRSIADQLKFLLFDGWITLLGFDFKLPEMVFDFLTVWLLIGAASHRGYDGTLSLFSEVYPDGQRFDISRLLKNLALGPIGLKNNLRIFTQFIWPRSTYRKWKKSGGQLSFEGSGIEEKVVMAETEIEDFFAVFRVGAVFNLIFLLAPFLGAVFFFTWNWMSL